MIGSAGLLTRIPLQMAATDSGGMTVIPKRWPVRGLAASLLSLTMMCVVMTTLGYKADADGGADDSFLVAWALLLASAASSVFFVIAVCRRRGGDSTTGSGSEANEAS
jgi:hypothetical protein